MTLITLEVPIAYLEMLRCSEEKKGLGQYSGIEEHQSL